jgi:hypothetical protein
MTEIMALKILDFSCFNWWKVATLQDDVTVSYVVRPHGPIMADYLRQAENGVTALQLPKREIVNKLLAGGLHGNFLPTAEVYNSYFVQSAEVRPDPR